MGGRARWLRLAALCAALAASAAVAAARPSAALIVEQELAFAQSAAEHGTRAAFLAVLADSAVLMQPRAVPARATLEAGAGPGAPLRFRPDLASISARGDFGWASGPFSHYRESAGDRPDVVGHYVTVWRREDGGAWRVILDGGVPYPIADGASAAHLAVSARLRPTASAGAAPDCSAEFAARWQAQGRARALKEFLAADARLLYAGAAPRDARAIEPKLDPLAAAPLHAARIARTLASEDGDVAVDYGEYELGATLEVPARHVVFIRAWDLGHRCRLALEALSPGG